MEGQQLEDMQLQDLKEAIDQVRHAGMHLHRAPPPAYTRIHASMRGVSSLRRHLSLD